MGRVDGSSTFAEPGPQGRHVRANCRQRSPGRVRALTDEQIERILRGLRTRSRGLPVRRVRGWTGTQQGRCKAFNRYQMVVASLCHRPARADRGKGLRVG